MYLGDNNKKADMYIWQIYLKSD